MDFEDWLRDQLAATPARAVGPTLRRRRGSWRPARILGAPLATAFGVLVAVGLLGLGTQAGLRDQQLASVAVAPALPVTTWAGTPPPVPSVASSEVKPGDADPPAALSARVATLTAGRASASPNRTPGGGESAPAPAPPARPPSGATQTFALTGGTATISCGAGGPSLVSSTPKAGFQQEMELENGGTVLSVRFRSSTHESRVDASCVSGAVQGRVEESPS